MSVSGTVNASELLEEVNLKSGHLLLAIVGGRLVKTTVDTLFRTHNNDYFLSSVVDPIATDANSNTYGRYHFTTSNTMISGNPTAIFRLDGTHMYISETGNRTLIDYDSVSDQRRGARIILENPNTTSDNYSSILAKGNDDDIFTSISFVNKGSSTGEIAFATRATSASSVNEAVRIDRDGQVGFGITDPSGTFHVYGENENAFAYFSPNSETYDSALFLYGGGSNYKSGLCFRFDSSTKNSYIYNSSSGALNSLSFHVLGAPPEFGGAGKTVFTVDGGQKVGINLPTGTATHSLQVSGDIAVTGDLTTARGIILSASDGSGKSYRITVDAAGNLHASGVS